MTQKRLTRNKARDYEHARYRHGHPLPVSQTDDEQVQSNQDHHTTLIEDGGVTTSAGDGAHSEQDCFRDRWAYTLSPGFATGARNDPQTGFQPARTTFYAKDAPSDQEDRYDHLWTIQHGLDGWAECPIDEVERGHRINRSRRGKYLASDTTLQALDVPSHVHEEAIRLAFTTDCRAFSSHYGGVHGAAIGFALFSLFETQEEAMDSAYWPEVRELCSSLDIDPGDLASYVFQRFGGT